MAAERIGRPTTIAMSAIQLNSFHGRRTGPAPGDEYFGPLKMSVFGVRNVIDTANVKLDTGASIDCASTLRSLAQVELSMRAWQAVYPKDNWLPRMYARLVKVYSRLPDSHAKLHSADLASQLIVKFPNSPEAAAFRAQVAASFAAPPATSSPVAMPAPAPVASPSLVARGTTGPSNSTLR